MTRRQFTLLLPAAAAARPFAGAARITAIATVPVQGRFHKFVAMNSYDAAPKGHTYQQTLIRIRTDQGIEGIGVAGRMDAGFPDAVRALLGADPLATFTMEGGRITGRAPAFEALLRRYKHLDIALFDLAGKLTNKPCWNLLAAAPARDAVEVYDGTLYFADVWFRDRGVRAVLEEVEEALRRGYRGVKLKAGRGSKWMERDAGLARDIEVIRAARNAAGPEIKILADPNNGYRGDFDRAWRLLAETSGAKLHWIEEIFPESVPDYTRLREKMVAARIRTLIADGENAREPEDLAPYLTPNRLVDVVQYDVRAGGFIENARMARMAAAAGAVSVPHNWASNIALFAGLHLAKAFGSIPAAEDDRSTCDAIVAEGYNFRNGRYSLPDAPGLGLRIDEKVYAEKYKAAERVVS
jgi:L-alanine-DL-glutamate epimerase-like enolase superfamily enzyme